MKMNTSRLEGACNLNVQLFIYITPVEYLDYYGNEIYCCLQNDCFASSWIYYLDQNLDTVEAIPWEEMYNQIIDRKNQYAKRIPPPPTKEQLHLKRRQSLAFFFYFI